MIKLIEGDDTKEIIPLILSSRSAYEHQIKIKSTNVEKAVGFLKISLCVSVILICCRRVT